MTMNDNARGGMTLDAATAWIEKTLGGKPDTVAEHAGGGWSFEIPSTSRFAVGILEENDLFNYCFIEVTNDDEVGRYREVIMQALDPVGGAPGVIVEGLYDRPLTTSDVANANFTGRIAIVPKKSWEAWKKIMATSYGERAFAEQLDLLQYVREGLRNALHHTGNATPAASRERAVALINELNMMILQEDRDDAA